MPTSIFRLDHKLVQPRSVSQIARRKRRLMQIAWTIHGGGFATGDTFHIFLGHVKYLLDRGFCVISSEYRLLPQ